MRSEREHEKQPIRVAVERKPLLGGQSTASILLGSPLVLASLIVIAGISIGVFHFLVTALSKRLFGLDVPDGPELVDNVSLESLPTRVLLVDQQRERIKDLLRILERQGLQCDRVDLEKSLGGTASLQSWLRRRAEVCDVLVLEGLDRALESRSRRNEVLGFLWPIPKNRIGEPTRVVIVVDRHPDRVLEEILGPAQSELVQWRGALQAYETVALPDRYHLLVRSSRSQIDQLIDDLGGGAERRPIVVVDFAKPEGNKAPSSANLPSSSVLVIEGVEKVLLDSEHRRSLLELLERVVRDNRNALNGAGRSVIVTSSAPPPTLVTLVERDVNPSPIGPNSAEGLRWAQVWEHFAIRWPRPLRHCFNRGQRGADQLAREREAWPELHRIHDQVERELSAATNELNAHEVASLVAARAELFYRAQWDLCDHTQRLLLIHLADRKLVNSKEPALVRGLLLRGLLRRGPELELASESFAWFVRAAEERSTISGWEREEARGPWRIVRGPFGVAIAVAVALLVAAGGEAALSTLTVLSGLMGGLPVLLELAGRLSGRSAGSGTAT